MSGNQYNYGSGGTGKKDGDWLSWALIVFLFATGIWPIALIVLFLKLSDNDSGKKRRQQSPPPLATEASSPRAAAAPPRARQEGARRTQSAARKVTRTPAMKSSNARWMKVVGVIAAAIGIFAAAETLDTIFWLGVDRYELWELLQNLAWLLAGGGLFFAGRTMDRRAARYQKYLAVIGEFEAMSIEDISKKLGIGRKTVEKDLARMIDKGVFGTSAYLDVALGYFFRSGQADAELRRSQQAAKEEKGPPPKEAEEGYSGILRNIRRANDQIADPVLTAKIDHLESITARIFRAVEEDPKKKDRISTFLNYYLPTTQKLLDSYAEFESAGIEGENLRQAKQRIEDTMDSIIKGFERQLDELYAADYMDVDSDIRVMETMLNRDGASVERDFGLGKKDVDLGGTAAQSKESD